PAQEIAAARLAAETLGDEIAPARREEKAVAVLDQLLQQRAAVVHGENLGRALIRLDQRTVQLLERQRIVEERGVDDRARDRQLAGRHVPPPLARVAGELRRRRLIKEREAFRRARTAVQPAVRNISVPSVAHAAPSIDSAGI